MAAVPQTLLTILNQSAEFLKHKGSQSPRLDAEVLLAHALGKTRVGLYTAFDQPVSEAELDTMRDVIRRRAKREPVAYITGEKEFYSRVFRVTPHVLVPRPETELLVEHVEKVMKEKGQRPNAILDLGTGSGVLAVTLALMFPESRVDAVDLSPAALVVAAENAARHGCADRIAFRALDMADAAALSALNAYDLVVSNPPYLSEADYAGASPDIRQYEPKQALVAPEEGLFFYRSLFQALPGLLHAGGVCLAEIGSRQREPIHALVSATLGETRYTTSFYKDYACLDRGVILCPSAI